MYNSSLSLGYRYSYESYLIVPAGITLSLITSFYILLSYIIGFLLNIVARLMHEWRYLAYNLEICSPDALHSIHLSDENVQNGSIVYFSFYGSLYKHCVKLSILRPSLFKSVSWMQFLDVV